MEVNCRAWNAHLTRQSYQLANLLNHAAPRQSASRIKIAQILTVIYNIDWAYGLSSHHVPSLALSLLHILSYLILTLASEKSVICKINEEIEHRRVK